MIGHIRFALGLLLTLAAIVLLPSTAWASNADTFPVKIQCLWTTGGTTAESCDPSYSSTGISGRAYFSITLARPSSLANDWWNLVAVPHGAALPATGAPLSNFKSFGACNACTSKTFPVGVGQTPGQVDYDVYAVGGFDTVTNVHTSRIVRVVVAVTGGSVNGSLVEPPPATSSCGTSTGFRNVSKYVESGTIDLTWKWAGVVPSRGWTVTNATSVDPPGAGTVQGSVPATELAGLPGRYGLQSWTIPAGVGSIRVQQRGAAGCFFGFSVQRDAAGVVTGITIGGAAPPDTSPDTPGAVDEGGSNCSLLDIPCMLAWLFVPDPSSWGVDAVIEQAKLRPPFSIAVQGVDSSKAFVGAFSAAECRSLSVPLLEGATQQDGGQGGNGFSCASHSGTADREEESVIYRVVQAGLIALTALALWKMVAAGFKPE